jgi:predicted nucleotidyltransferase
VKFDVKRREQKNLSRYLNEDIQIARKFGKIMYKEFGKFISALVLFGSAAQHDSHPKKDIDVLIVLDDVRIRFSKELVETYRIIAEKAIAAVDPKRLHVQSMKLSAFWEYVRAGDPVAINILRSGVALIDQGFFDPLQALLDQGRIRPSAESIWTYFTMAPASLHRSEQHMLTAAVDLYWAAIDAAHSALMVAGETPPSPVHVSGMLDKVLVKHGHVSKKSAKSMAELFKLFKGITHRDIKSLSGKDYDRYKKMSEGFVQEMRSFIEGRR